MAVCFTVGGFMARRCPWCGKKINRYADQSRAFSKRKKTPSKFVFAQCNCCSHYYGQKVTFKKFLFGFGIPTLIFIVSYIVQNGYLGLLAIVPPILLTRMRYTRLDENEELVPLEPELQITADVLEQYKKIKSGRFYFLQADFDEHDTFSVASPLYISKIRQKTKLQGHLLYDHTDNDKYCEACIIYDGRGDLIAKVKIYKKLT